VTIPFRVGGGTENLASGWFHPVQLLRLSGRDWCSSSLGDQRFRRPEVQAGPVLTPNQERNRLSPGLRPGGTGCEPIPLLLFEPRGSEGVPKTVIQENPSRCPFFSEIASWCLRRQFLCWSGEPIYFKAKLSRGNAYSDVANNTDRCHAMGPEEAGEEVGPKNGPRFRIEVR